MTAFSVAVAALVFFARPDRFQNRSLALVLFLFGVMGFGSQGLAQLTDDPRVAFGSAALLYAPGAAVSFVYLAFVGTLPTPLARPFAGAWVRRALLGLAVAAAALAVVFMDRIVVDVVGGAPGAPWTPRLHPATLWMWYAVAAAVLYGFFAALSVARNAPRDGPLRKQATIFAIAFGVRDLWYVLTLVALTLVQGDPEAERLLLYQFPSLTLFVTALLAYGILRHQLFDIDLKIKWGIRRGTLAAIFLAAFFVVATVASEFLTGTYGFALGGVAAGLLLFALAPLQRIAERVADRAMPNVRDDAEYRHVRKREVYRAAIEGALEDGRITERERAILARLQDQLGMTATDALELERDVAAGAQAKA